MEKTLTIDGRDVKFRATAAVPRLYRIKFRRDIIQDMQTIQASLAKQEESGGSLPPEALTMFENVAYIMAKHGDKDAVPDNPDEWLDSFNTFSIYEVFQEIIDLWGLNMESTSDAKKTETNDQGDEHGCIPASGGTIGRLPVRFRPADHRHGERYVHRAAER